MEKEKLETYILDLWKNGTKCTWDIGRKVKEEHGIGNVRSILGLGIKRFIEKSLNIRILDHYENAQQKAERVKNHTEKHKQDIHARRNYTRLRNVEYSLRKYHKLAIRR